MKFAFPLLLLVAIRAHAVSWESSVINKDNEKTEFHLEKGETKLKFPNGTKWRCIITAIEVSKEEGQDPMESRSLECKHQKAMVSAPVTCYAKSRDSSHVALHLSDTQYIRVTLRCKN
jgi:hypothetical protein